MPRAKESKSGEAEGYGTEDQTVEESKEQRLRRIQKQWQKELTSRLRNKDASEGSLAPGDQDHTDPEVFSENDQVTEETQGLNEEEAGPFYSLALPFPKKHHKLAEVLALIHHYQARYEMTTPEFSEDIPGVAGIVEALGHNHECSNDLLIMKLIDWLGTGDYESVFLVAEAFKGYELSLPDLDGERNRGKFCAMVVCNDLQRAGLSRAQINKTMVRERADGFRAILDLKKVRSTREGKKLRGFKWSAEAIENQLKVGQLTKHDWTCIYKDLALEDIRGNPGNQKIEPAAP